MTRNSPVSVKMGTFAGLQRLTPLAAVSCVAGVLALSQPAPAIGQALERIELAVGTNTINVQYPAQTLPLVLGYWKDEGLEVELIPAGGSLQAVQLVAAGEATFATAGSTAIFQAASRGMPLRIAQALTNTIWYVSVPADGNIESVADLKGKTVGVPTIATGAISLLQAYLAENGIKLEEDIELIPLGYGAAPVAALESGQVDALYYWGSATAGFENAGLKIRRFADEEWANYPDYALTFTEDTIREHPDMVVAVARGIAKGTTFLLANPDCARKVFWKHFPEVISPGETDEIRAMKDDYLLANVIDEMTHKSVDPSYPGVTVEKFQKFHDYLLNTKQIETSVSVEEILVEDPEFAKRVNDFDVAAIQKSARECQI